MQDADARTGWNGILSKICTWLVPTLTALLLVLAFSISERIRANTPEGKFNRIKLDMHKEQVHNMLGSPEVRYKGPYEAGHFEGWHFDDFMIVVLFDDQDSVLSKRMVKTFWAPFDGPYQH